MLRRPAFASYMSTRSFAVCTILRGCECVCSCMNPSGRQCASGLSFESFAMRCLRSSAAHGVNGNPPSKPCPTLKNLASGGSVSGFRFGSAGAGGPPGGTRLSQVPEKSILPFGRRGGGASRFSLPSAVRGSSLRTNAGHWACALVAAVAARMHATGKRRTLSTLQHESLRAAVVHDLRGVEVAFRIGRDVVNDVELAGARAFRADHADLRHRRAIEYHDAHWPRIHDVQKPLLLVRRERRPRGHRDGGVRVV